MRAELEINRPTGVRRSGTNVPAYKTSRCRIWSWRGGAVVRRSRGGSPVTRWFAAKRGRADREEQGTDESGPDPEPEGVARWFAGRKKRGRAERGRLLAVVSPVSSSFVGCS
ncbi:hypothetical protein ACJRO7_023978 [Eucalyptus globulus]|uniref:Uncharacterized protein n=1 Tax=Eucalyptus globulus TaxID=34317 RepID=A0ABD3K9N0_EUCGL